MKKLLLVTDAWAPQVNGVVRVQDALIERLEEKGIEVLVVEPGQFRCFPMPFYREIRVALFPRRKIARIIRKERPDAIHIMTEGSLGWATRAVCRSQQLPFTTWYHSHFQLFFDARLRGLLRPVVAYMRRFHHPAARTIVSTESLKRELESLGYRNVVVAPLGVDTDLFTRAQPSPLPELPKPVFVYFGRLAPEKSPEEFLAMDLPGTKLVIGDGPHRARLEAKYPHGNTFVGYRHGKDLVNWLSLADVFVFPSRTETFGLVVLEALACGIPVAAHRVMGPQDIITEGKDGYLGEDLRDAALKCLALSRDDCRAKALQYSWAVSTDTFIAQMVPIHWS